MTDAEWLACADPTPMLEFLRGKASDRKLRLFACGCCRRVWGLIRDERFRNALRAAELFADSMVTQEEMLEARGAAMPAFAHLHADDEAPAAALSASGIPAPKKSFSEHLVDAFADPWWEDEFDKGDPHAPAVVTARRAAWAVARAQGQQPLLNPSSGQEMERQAQGNLIRCIFGNPFRPSPPLPPAVLLWNDTTVRCIAEGIYEERAFRRLPILADALLDAGCDNEELITHCRSEEPHVRGCWAVDLILGKG
jgi:hypothetical protein